MQTLQSESSASYPAALAVEMHGIAKRFGDLEANVAVDFSVRTGEIHCLVGENGAGKTTLMNILYGLLQPDSGEIRIFGQGVRLHTPQDAMRHSIGMVHQHFMLVDSYSVAENVVLGQEPRRGLLVDRRHAIDRTRELSAQYGLIVDPMAVVRDLPVGVRQRVEILKTLYRGSRILILDEPTAVLTPQESADLFATLANLVRNGMTVIFITHKLKEVLAVADRVTVLRRGRLVGVLDRQEITEQRLATMMVGREVFFQYKKTPANPGKVVLDVRDLSVLSDLGHWAVKEVSLVCRKGEIVTIAGVEGNGQSELVEVIAGMRCFERGEVLINNQKITRPTPRLARQAGLTHVPADRVAVGLCVGETLEENLVAGRHNSTPYCRSGFLRWKEIENFCRRAIQQFDIRAARPTVLVKTLSGGNMQKAVLAREMLFESDLLLAVSPTRGVDVAAIESIHKLLIQARDQGRAVLVVSTDLDEVLQISDRILVMYNGKIVGEFDPRQTSREELGRYMIGGQRANQIGKPVSEAQT